MVKFKGHMGQGQRSHRSRSNKDSKQRQVGSHQRQVASLLKSEHHHPAINNELWSRPEKIFSYEITSYKRGGYKMLFSLITFFFFLVAHSNRESKLTFAYL